MAREGVWDVNLGRCVLLRSEEKRIICCQYGYRKETMQDYYHLLSLPLSSVVFVPQEPTLINHLLLLLRRIRPVLLVKSRVAYLQARDAVQCSKQNHQQEEDANISHENTIRKELVLSENIVGGSVGAIGLTSSEGALDLLYGAGSLVEEGRLAAWGVWSGGIDDGVAVGEEGKDRVEERIYSLLVVIQAWRSWVSLTMLLQHGQPLTSTQISFRQRREIHPHDLRLHVIERRKVARLNSIPISLSPPNPRQHLKLTARVDSDRLCLAGLCDKPLELVDNVLVGFFFDEFEGEGVGGFLCHLGTEMWCAVRIAEVGGGKVRLGDEDVNVGVAF